MSSTRHNLIRDEHGEVKVVAIDKDITLHLLTVYGFDYEVVGKKHRTLAKKAYGLIESDVKVLKLAKKFKPDILIDGSPYLAHVIKLIGKSHMDNSVQMRSNGNEYQLKILDCVK